MSNYAPRTIRCVEHLRTAVHLPGDIIELGVSAGDTTIPMAQFIKENGIDKKIYACDTFEGLPYDGKEGIDDMLKKGECAFGFDRFWERVKSYGVEDIIVPVPGLVEKTLYTELQDKEWCFAFLDMDLYEPTSYATRYLDDRIVVGGIQGYHDYKFERCPGIEIVVDQEVDRQKYKMFGDHWGNCAWLQRVR